MLNISGYEEIDRADYLNIKAGRDVVLSSGEIVKNNELTLRSYKIIKFCFL